MQRLDEEWRAFLNAIDAVPEGAQTRPGVIGDWSVRDLLVHISSWEGEFLKALPLILEGKRLPRYSTTYGGIDAFNQLSQERSASRTLDQVRHELAATHERLVETLEALPDDAFSSKTRVARRLRLDTYAHYREHTGQLLAWTERRP